MEQWRKTRELHLNSSTEEEEGSSAPSDSDDEVFRKNARTQRAAEPVRIRPRRVAADLARKQREKEAAAGIQVNHTSSSDTSESEDELLPASATRKQIATKAPNVGRKLGQGKRPADIQAPTTTTSTTSLKKAKAMAVSSTTSQGEDRHPSVHGAIDRAPPDHVNVKAGRRSSNAVSAGREISAGKSSARTLPKSERERVARRKMKVISTMDPVTKKTGRKAHGKIDGHLNLSLTQPLVQACAASATRQLRRAFVVPAMPPAGPPVSDVADICRSVPRRLHSSSQAPQATSTSRVTVVKKAQVPEGRRLSQAQAQLKSCFRTDRRCAVPARVFFPLEPDKLVQHIPPPEFTSHNGHDGDSCASPSWSEDRSVDSSLHEASVPSFASPPEVLNPRKSIEQRFAHHAASAGYTNAPAQDAPDWTYQHYRHPESPYPHESQWSPMDDHARQHDMPSQERTLDLEGPPTNEKEEREARQRALEERLAKRMYMPGDMVWIAVEGYTNHRYYPAVICEREVAANGNITLILQYLGQHEDPEEIKGTRRISERVHSFFGYSHMQLLSHIAGNMRQQLQGSRREEEHKLLLALSHACYLAALYNRKGKDPITNIFTGSGRENFDPSSDVLKIKHLQKAAEKLGKQLCMGDAHADSNSLFLLMKMWREMLEQGRPECVSNDDTLLEYRQTYVASISSD
jgi:hypothetical protein